MCLNPTYIKNVHFHKKSDGISIVNTSSKVIPVPCGHCAECVTSRHLGIIQRCELEEIYGHPFVFFLSYQPSMIPSLTCSDGVKVTYFDFDDLKDCFKRIRSKNLFGRPFRYIVMSERGEHGVPHCHGLLYVKKESSDSVYTVMNLEKKVHDVLLSEWKRNVAPLIPYYNKKTGVTKLVPNRRNPVYKPLCIPIEYFVAGKRRGTYGCHYVYYDQKDGSTIGAVTYATKYFLKDDNFTSRLQSALRLNLHSIEYHKIWNKVRNRWISSRNFGFGLYDYQNKKVSKTQRLDLLSSLDTFKYLKICLDRSIVSQESPKYFSRSDGRTLPLSRYFYHVGNLYTKPVYDHFKQLSNMSESGDYFVCDPRTDEQFDNDKISKTRNVKNRTRFTDLTDLIY